MPHFTGHLASLINCRKASLRLATPPESANGLANSYLDVVSGWRLDTPLLRSGVVATYKQNLPSWKIAIVQLITNHWPTVQPAAATVAIALNAAASGGYETVAIAFFTDDAKANSAREIDER